MCLRDYVVPGRDPGVYLANEHEELWMLVQERELHPSYIGEGLRWLRYRGQVPMVSYTNCIIVWLFPRICVDLAWASVLGMAPWVVYVSAGTKCAEMLAVQEYQHKTRCL